MRMVADSVRLAKTRSPRSGTNGLGEHHHVSEIGGSRAQRDALADQIAVGVGQPGNDQLKGLPSGPYRRRIVQVDSQPILRYHLHVAYVDVTSDEGKGTVCAVVPNPAVELQLDSQEVDHDRIYDLNNREIRLQLHR